MIDLHVDKAAPDPTDIDGFIRIETSLANVLKRKAAPAQKATIDVIRNTLLNPPITEGGIAEFGLAVHDEVLGLAEPTVAATVDTIKGSARSIYTRTRRSLRRKVGLGAIGRRFEDEDFETVRFLQDTHTFYMRDQFGAISDIASERARTIVASGLKQGFGPADIAKQLEAKILNRLRRKGYMETIASVFVNRSRTTSELNAYGQVGIEVFIFRAVLDEATTDICSFLDGKRFSVGKAKDRVKETAALPDPSDVRFFMPFLREMKVDDQKVIGFLSEDGRKNIVAEIIESNIGQPGPGGLFAQKMSEEAMQDSGIGPPPVHFRCRSDAEPVFE